MERWNTSQNRQKSTLKPQLSLEQNWNSRGTTGTRVAILPVNPHHSPVAILPPTPPFHPCSTPVPPRVEHPTSPTPNPSTDFQPKILCLKCEVSLPKKNGPSPHPKTTPSTPSTTSPETPHRTTSTLSRKLTHWLTQNSDPSTNGNPGSAAPAWEEESTWGPRLPHPRAVHGPPPPPPPPHTQTAAPSPHRRRPSHALNPRAVPLLAPTRRPSHAPTPRPAPHPPHAPRSHIYF